LSGQRDQLGSLGAIAYLPASGPDLLTQKVRAREVALPARPLAFLCEPIRLSVDGGDGGHALEGLQMSKADRAEHLAQIGIARGSFSPVGFADPLEEACQRLRGVEVI